MEGKIKILEGNGRILEEKMISLERRREREEAMEWYKRRRNGEEIQKIIKGSFIGIKALMR